MKSLKRGIFITGTDTGVGKTYIAAGIAAALKNCGADVGVMKPAETGCPLRNGRPVPSDALRLMKAAGTKDPLALVNPYRFRAPLAPYVAAELEGKKISPGKIIEAHRKLAAMHDLMIVEGAGGIMVPLSHDYLFIDLVVDLEMPVVIIARPGLGTINHTLMTVSALKQRGVGIVGIVINHSSGQKAGLAERTNPKIIGKFSSARILGIVPHGSRKFKEIAGLIYGNIHISPQ